MCKTFMKLYSRPLVGARTESVLTFQAKAERSTKTDEQSDEEQLASLTFNVEEEDVKPDDSIERVWSSRRSLKSHLDIVRAVAFGHGPGILFASAGDDCSVKVWSVESAAVMLTR